MTFLKKLNLFDIGDTFRDTINRFWISFICTFVCFALGIAQIYSLGDIPKGLIGNAIFLSVIGFFWCGIVQLYRESHVLAKKPAIAISIIGMIFFYLLVFIPESGEGARLISIVGSLVVLVSSVPFVFNKYDNLSFWSFNKKFGFGVSTSFVASLILFGGASAALASVGYLFEIKISHRAYSTLWLFGATLLSPLYALSFIPEEFEEKSTECATPKQVSFIANWILAPLIAVYLAILYAYFIKIGVTGDVPKGELASMITGFAVAGILTYLISWPCVFSGQANKLLKFLMQWFFPLMVIPVLFLFYAICVRIHQYGFTEQRYIVLVAAIWFGFLVIGFSLKKLQLKHMTLSLALLLFLGSWGPWGMYDVSERSQVNGLKAVLVENNLLEEGEIVKANAPEDVPLEDRVDITSRVNYLMRYNYRYSRLKEAKAAKNLKEVYGFTDKKDFFDAVGFKPASPYELKRQERITEEGTFDFGFDNHIYGRAVNVRGANYFINSVHVYKKNERKIKIDDKRNIVFTLKDNVAIVDFEGRGQAKIPLKAIVQKLLKENPKQERKKQYHPIKAKGRGFNIMIELSNISGELTDGGEPMIKSLSGRTFITLK